MYLRAVGGDWGIERYQIFTANMLPERKEAGFNLPFSLEKIPPICTRKNLCSRMNLACGAVEIYPPPPPCQMRRLRRAVSLAVFAL